MKNTEVQKLVDDTFAFIETAESIDELQKIFDDSRIEIIKKNRMDDETYPQLHFKITADELKDVDFLINSDTFSKDITKLKLDPLTKLLYAICWKNGDLKKVKHIIQGVTSNQTDIDDKNDGLVFYQFGKYLTKKSGEPIIDQHVLRAYEVYRADKTDKSIDQIRSKSTVTKKDKALIDCYKLWLATGLTESLRKNEDFCYHIDRVLFALGKTIKAKRKTTVANIV